MRARSLASPHAGALRDVSINSVDSYHIRIAISGTSIDKYPGKSHYDIPFSLCTFYFSSPRRKVNETLQFPCDPFMIACAPLRSKSGVRAKLEADHMLSAS